MVESVTGRLPFASDTTLGTLTARTVQPIVAGEELGLLEPVIDRVGAIDPNDRYPDAATMRQAIADAADALPPPGPLLLAGMIDRADPHPTRAAPVHAAPLFDQDAVDARASELSVETEPDRKRVTPGERRLVPWIVAVTLIVIAGLAFGALAQLSSASAVSIPGLRGLTTNQAIAAARAQGLTASVASTRAAPDPKGTVIEQSPGAGAFSSSRRVALVVSGGPAPVAVPKIVNVSWDQAKQALDGAGLIYAAAPTTQYDEKVPAGSVISVTPGVGTQIPPDGKVTVVVSSGHAPVKIPDVSNMSYADAAAALTAQNFKPRQADKTEFSDTVAAGDVIGTDPAIGDPAPYGSEVVVHVSKGPDLVLVPSVFGMTFSDAFDYLAQFGFQTSIPGNVRPHDRVRQQSPAADTKAARNSTITIGR